MQVGELIERLEELDSEAEILIATQPNWPLQFRLAGVVSDNELAPEDDDFSFDADHARCVGFERGMTYCPECDQDAPEGTEAYDYDTRSQEGGTEVVYLVEGGHPDHPYAPRQVFEML